MESVWRAVGGVCARWSPTVSREVCGGGRVLVDVCVQGGMEGGRKSVYVCVDVCVCVCMHVWMYVCVCVCVCVLTRT